jgi:hypothetical protein
MKILFMGDRSAGKMQIKRLEDMLRTSPIEGVTLRKQDDEPVQTEDNEYILDIEGNGMLGFSRVLARGVAEHHGFIVTEE